MKINKIAFYQGLVCYLVSISFAVADSKPDSKPCTYSTYEWNTIARKAVNFREVKKPYDQLLDNEIDPVSGCSICREDQVFIKLPKTPQLRVCKYLAENIEKALEISIAHGLKINSLKGYRVGKTRGVPDELGNRTQYSNHSYGIAIDVNAENNGLYDRCLQFGPECRLIKGGRWNEESIDSLRLDSPLVIEMINAGFKWGGNILGKQKDFMHFSISGY